MILLQAAMAGGFYLLIILAVLFFGGMLICVRLLMRMFWQLPGKEEYVRNNSPYYKDPGNFIVSILIAAVIMFFVCNLFIIVLDWYMPSIE